MVGVVKLPPLTVSVLELPVNHRLLAPIVVVPPDCVKTPSPPLSSLTSMPTDEKKPLVTATVPDRPAAPAITSCRAPPPPLAENVPPAMVNRPPLAEPIAKVLAEVYVSVPVSVTAPREKLMAPDVFVMMPASVRVPVPLFVRPAPLVMADSIVALAFAVIVGLLPAKPSVPPVSV